MTVAIIAVAFLKEKSDLAETMLGLFNNLKIKFDLQVQYLCCNIAGKNQAFEKKLKEGLGINFEYTTLGMPQQNECIECKLAPLFNWLHAMLNSGKFTDFLQIGLWAEAANTAMLLEKNLFTPNRTLRPFQHFFGKGKKHVLTSMQNFDEMCTTTYKDNTHQAKLANCGISGIWVGYAENYLTSTYKIFNP